VQKGFLFADIHLNFNKNGKIDNNYKIKGFVSDVNLTLFNKQTIQNINFNYELSGQKFFLNNAHFEINKINLTSKLIEIENKNKIYLIKGNINNSESYINNEFLSNYFKNIKNSGLADLNFSSKNDFSFNLSNKFKFSNLKINSKINLKKLNYKFDSFNVEKFIPNYKGEFSLKNHNVEFVLNDKDFIINSNGKIIIDKESDEVNLNIQSKNGYYNIKSEIQINNNPILIKSLNYNKEESKKSTLNINILVRKDKTVIVENFLFQESNNNIVIENLSLNKNFKIKHVDTINLNFLNKNKIENKILLKRNKKKYEISGETFDGSFLIEELLDTDNEKDIISQIFNNLESNINININKTYIDDTAYINNLNGNLVFLKNSLVDLNLTSNFPDNKKINLTIKTSSNGEKVTTFFSSYANPFVKKYKFVKGFENGILNFFSSKKNNISQSQLKIYDFKLKELPVLTKILTLASLQGIADLLSGEGITFDEFEMNFSNKGKSMTIDEVYAIGPAISILMSGYVETNKMISLRGTLVPATTLNKFVGSIPIVGNILVGKKTGEGVFGVSFKIKGPPKNLKTIVNPIKTLTPRFITRTLEKIKKTN